METDIVMDLIQQSINHIRININNEFDTLFVKGLNKQGFYFDNKIQLEKFVKEHCREEDNISLRERVYYVKNVPFMLHKYESDISLKPIQNSGTTYLRANLGKYIFL